MNKYQREGVSQIQYSNSADGALLTTHKLKKGTTHAKKVVQIKEIHFGRIAYLI